MMLEIKGLSSYIDSLLSQPILAHADLKMLRKPFDEMEAHVGGLEGLDVPRLMEVC